MEGTEIKFHPLCEIFPKMEGEEWQEFCNDIEMNGLQQPILIDVESNTIIDGRNRYLACLELKIEPRFEPLANMSEEQMARKVIAENYNRRHLTDQQKMIITADLVKQGMITRENAEKLLDVSGRTLSKAIRVAGAPDEVKSLVESNKVSIGKATNFLDGKISQEEMLADGRKEGKTGEGRGRPIGNAKLNKFYKCLKQVHESLSDEVPDVVFRNWTGDPEQEMQLYEVAEKLNNLVERIEDVKKPKAVGT